MGPRRGAPEHGPRRARRRRRAGAGEGDHDVFGDGSVVVLAMPGHTPGNTSLLVRGPGGAIVLAGDTVHLRAALDHPAPMAGDTDPDAALASIHRLRAIAEREDAPVWVGHDPDDWERFGGPGPVGRAASTRG